MTPSYWQKSFLGQALITAIVIGSVSPFKSNGLCPEGYWATKFVTKHTLGNDIFELHPLAQATGFGFSHSDWICQHCKNVKCFVVRHSGDCKPSQARKQQSGCLIATCQKFNSLPSREDIVMDLDCVQIGSSRLNYILFIYKPRYYRGEEIVADCVDPDLLKWMAPEEQLLGLELGFKMKYLPESMLFFNKAQMNNTKYMCLDGSAMADKGIREYVYVHNAKPKHRMEALIISKNGLKRERIYTESNNTETCKWSEGAYGVPDSKSCKIDPSNMFRSPDSFKALTKATCLYKTMEILLNERATNEENSTWYCAFYEQLTSGLLGAIVLFLIVGTITVFCVRNRDRVNLFKRKKHKPLVEEEDQSAKLDQQQQLTWSQPSYPGSKTAGSGGVRFFPPGN